MYMYLYMYMYMYICICICTYVCNHMHEPLYMHMIHTRYTSWMSIYTTIDIILCPERNPNRPLRSELRLGGAQRSEPDFDFGK